MNKLRGLSSKPKKNSTRWDMSAAKRKSMSLHDLTEAPIDSSSLHQNSSLMTLDSIPKSRDSGLSRSASRLSLASTGLVLADDTPRSPSKSDLKNKNAKLEAENKTLQKIIREQDRTLKEHKLSYKVLFEKHQDLNLKYAQLQNELDRYRCQGFSKKSPPQNLVENIRRNSLDERSSVDRVSFLDSEVWKSSASEVSQSDQSETQDFTLTSTETTLTPEEHITSEEEDESTPYVTEYHAQKDYEDAESTTTGSIAPSSSISLKSHPELDRLVNSPCLQQRPSPNIPQFHMIGCASRREESCSSPAPSSRWTLDKSFQLVSDSDRSEIGDEPTTFIESLNTEETIMMSTCKSEETLKADFDEIDVTPLQSSIPKSASISSINFISELPEESSTSKVQRWWRDSEFLPKNSTPSWKNSKKRPQNISFTNSPLLQRLKSPQNLSLLSPRPYQVRPNSVPSLSVGSGSLFVPPLDFSGLKSDTDQSAREDLSAKQATSKPAKQSPRIFNPFDQMVWKAQKNLKLSQKIVKSVAKSYANQSK